ncbi:MAG: glucosaminidase domain-containing protein [Eubacteriaceae bacterium]|nr:glucosaminidase domain-containing protein [Eubacteriaceae bacterium]
MKKICAVMMLLVFGILLLSEYQNCNSIIYNDTDEPKYEQTTNARAAYVDEEVEEELTVKEMIIKASSEYEIDSTLACAIARLETGNFTSDAYVYGNNVGGISIDEEPLSFDTLDDGVEMFVRNLRVNYYNEGLNEVDEIAGKYCPVNEKQWITAVKALMKEEMAY